MLEGFISPETIDLVLDDDQIMLLYHQGFMKEKIQNDRGDHSWVSIYLVDERSEEARRDAGITGNRTRNMQHSCYDSHDWQSIIVRSNPIRPEPDDHIDYEIYLDHNESARFFATGKLQRGNGLALTIERALSKPLAIPERREERHVEEFAYERAA